MKFTFINKIIGGSGIRSDVASFFEPSIQCIIQSIKEQRDASKAEIYVCYLLFSFFPLSLDH